MDKHRCSAHGEVPPAYETVSGRYVSGLEERGLGGGAGAGAYGLVDGDPVQCG